MAPIIPGCTQVGYARGPKIAPEVRAREDLRLAWPAPIRTHAHRPKSPGCQGPAATSSTVGFNRFHILTNSLQEMLEIPEENLLERLKEHFIEHVIEQGF